jgi:hypothetical protein
MICVQCKKKAMSAYDNIAIHVQEATALDYRTYFDSTIIVPLETTEGAFIREISKLYITEDHILVFDSEGTKLLLFDREGHFIRQIGVQGEGPEEYRLFNDVQFDRTMSVIYAHERFSNCIYTYDLSGHLIGKTPKASIFFNSFYKTDSGYWVYSCFPGKMGTGYNLTLLDHDLKTVKRTFFPQKKFVNAVFSSTFSESEDGRAFFISPSSNIIHELVGDSVVPFVKADFGEKTIPYRFVTEIEDSKEYDNLIADRKYLGNISNFKVNRRFCFFSFSETGYGIPLATYNCYYNYQAKQTCIYRNPYMESINYPVSTTLLYASNDVLVYALNLSVLTNNSYADISKKLGTDLQFDSNPVLTFLHLKDF